MQFAMSIVPMCLVPELNSNMDVSKFGVMPLNVYVEIINQISGKPRIGIHRDGRATYQ